MSIEVRRLRADEWAGLRALRLRALADAPTAFGSTLAVEQAYADEVWRERSLGASSGFDRATFIAERGGLWLGMATGLLDQQAPGCSGRLLVGMFVDGTARRHGVGFRLVDAVVDWARAGQAELISLWVTSDNDPAVSLYRRCGFSPTGRAKPHAHAAGLTEREMHRFI